MGRGGRGGSSSTSVRTRRTPKKKNSSVEPPEINIPSATHEPEDSRRDVVNPIEEDELNEFVMDLSQPAKNQLIVDVFDENEVIDFQEKAGGKMSVELQGVNDGRVSENAEKAVASVSSVSMTHFQDDQRRGEHGNLHVFEEMNDGRVSEKLAEKPAASVSILTMTVDQDDHSRGQDANLHSFQHPNGLISEAVSVLHDLFNSRADNLMKEIQELKQEVRELKQEMRGLQSSLSAMPAGNSSGIVGPESAGTSGVGTSGARGTGVITQEEFCSVEWKGQTHSLMVTSDDSLDLTSALLPRQVVRLVLLKHYTKVELRVYTLSGRGGDKKQRPRFPGWIPELCLKVLQICKPPDSIFQQNDIPLKTLKKEVRILIGRITQYYYQTRNEDGSKKVDVAAQATTATTTAPAAQATTATTTAPAAQARTSTTTAPAANDDMSFSDDE